MLKLNIGYYRKKKEAFDFLAWDGMEKEFLQLQRNQIINWRDY